MQRYYILVSFAVLLNLSAAKADHLRDSIGVENLKGKKLIIHQIVAKDTYYSIGRKYNVSPKVIMTYNDNKFLSLGITIKVPTERPFAEEAPSKAFTKPDSKKAAEAIKKFQESSTTATAAAGSAAAVTQDPELIDHAVQKKENLNMLADKYGTTVNELKRINNLKTINLRIGQILKVPVKAGANIDETTTAAVTEPAAAIPAPSRATRQSVPNKPVAAPTPVQETPSRDQLVVHTVAGNETMYSIASKYNLTLDQLKAKNNLSSNSLYVGQKLLISGQYPTKQEQAAATAGGGDDDKDSTETVKNPSLRMAPSRYGLSQMDEKGMAVVITDPDLDSSKMLVLHRTAPIGTIIKITNPMSNRSTFAKVIGKFTENESTKDVIIVMTKAVGDALGSLDKRFLCTLTYSGQANEQ